MFLYIICFLNTVCCIVRFECQISLSLSLSLRVCCSYSAVSKPDDLMVIAFVFYTTIGGLSAKYVLKNLSSKVCPHNLTYF